MLLFVVSNTRMLNSTSCVTIEVTQTPFQQSTTIGLRRLIASLIKDQLQNCWLDSRTTLNVRQSKRISIVYLIMERALDSIAFAVQKKVMALQMCFTLLFKNLKRKGTKLTTNLNKTRKKVAMAASRSDACTTRHQIQTKLKGRSIAPQIWLD